MQWGGSSGYPGGQGGGTFPSGSGQMHNSGTADPSANLASLTRGGWPAAPQPMPPLHSAPIPNAASLLSFLQRVPGDGAPSSPATQPLATPDPVSGLAALLNNAAPMPLMAPQPASTPPTAPLSLPSPDVLEQLLGLSGAAAGRPAGDDVDPVGASPLAEPHLAVVERVVTSAHARSKAASEIAREYAAKKRPEKNAAYVVLKAASHDMVHLSVETGLWSVSEEVEETLSYAYDQYSYVVLLFQVKDTGHFIGYGFMSTQIKARAEHQATVQQDLDNLPSEWQRPFRVSWVRIGSVPFPSVEHLVNTNDSSRSVIHSQDGQILTVSAGSELCNAIDAAAVPAALSTGVSKHTLRSKPEENTLKLDVTNLTFEQYVLAILTKRKQRLNAANKLRGKLGFRRKETVFPALKLPPVPASVGGPGGLPDVSSLASLLQNPSLLSLLTKS